MDVLLASQLFPPMTPYALGSLNVSISFRSASVWTMLSEAILIWATLDTSEALTCLNVSSSRTSETDPIILLLCTMSSNGPC